MFTTYCPTADRVAQPSSLAVASTAGSRSCASSWSRCRFVDSAALAGSAAFAPVAGSAAVFDAVFAAAFFVVARGGVAVESSCGESSMSTST